MLLLFPLYSWEHWGSERSSLLLSSISRDKQSQGISPICLTPMPVALTIILNQYSQMTTEDLLCAWPWMLCWDLGNSFLLSGPQHSHLSCGELSLMFTSRRRFEYQVISLVSIWISKSTSTWKMERNSVCLRSCPYLYHSCGKAALPSM